MQQYTRALRKIDQDSQLAETQVVQEFPHDPDGPGTKEIYVLVHIITFYTDNRAAC